jgi:hypothetical protein
VECRNFDNYGSCSYGEKCKFKHNGRAPKVQDLPEKLLSKRQRDNKKEDDQANNARDRGSKRGGRDGRTQKHKKRKVRDAWGLTHIEEDEYSNIAVTAALKKPSFSVVKLFKVMLINLLVFMVVGGGAFVTVSGSVSMITKFTPDHDTNNETAYVCGTIAAVAATTGVQYHYNLIDLHNDTVLNVFQKMDGKAVSDSGATCHVIKDDYLFKQMRKVRKVNQSIWMNNFKSTITHRGELTISLPVDGQRGKFQTLTLYNVAYVPSSAHSLFSVTSYLDGCLKLLDFKATVSYDVNSTVITLPGGGTYTGMRVGKLYEMDLMNNQKDDLIEWPAEKTNLRKETNSSDSDSDDSNDFEDNISRKGGEVEDNILPALDSESDSSDSEFDDNSSTQSHS